MLLNGACAPFAVYILSFNGHPPLGVNATLRLGQIPLRLSFGFNGHPPLGVNATEHVGAARTRARAAGFKGHPPLGVNATR